MLVKREPCECAVTLFRVARVHTRRQVNIGPLPCGITRVLAPVGLTGASAGSHQKGFGFAGSTTGRPATSSGKKASRPSIADSTKLSSANF